MIRKLFKTFISSEVETKMFKFFKKRCNNTKIKKNCKINTILVQTVEDYFYYGLFGKIISDIKDTRNINVEQIVIRNLSVGASKSFTGFLKSIFIYNRYKDKKWINLYSSFCDSVAIQYENSVNINTDIKLLVQSYQIFKMIKCKSDILNISYKGIELGELIYDSYLRYKPAPTINCNDYYLIVIIWQGLRNVTLTKMYFFDYNIKILLSSYSSYIQHGIATQVALKNNIKVFTFGNEQSLEKELSINDMYHTSAFLQYRQEFNKKKNTTLLLKEAQILLNSRLNGKIDIATSYMKESAYKIKINNIPNVAGSIVIFLHDFYDSIYNYGKLVFLDFIDWIEFTIKTLDEYNIDYYLKPHPNQIEDSAKVLDNLIIKYPHIKVLSSKITNRQLVDRNISTGISMYGTVAHELVYMGVPVILSAQNPHSSYSFCFESTTKNEYKNYIKNYKKLTLPIDYKEQVESFYYMHNLNNTKEELALLDIISQFRKINKLNSNDQITKFEEYIDSLSNNKAYNIFVKKLVKIVL